MLTLVDVALKSFDQQIRATKAGKISTRSCWRDLERSINRLEEKLEATQAMRDGFDRYRKSAEKFINQLDSSVSIVDDMRVGVDNLLILAEDILIMWAVDHAAFPGAMAVSVIPENK